MDKNDLKAISGIVSVILVVFVLLAGLCVMALKMYGKSNRAEAKADGWEVVGILSDEGGSCTVYRKRDSLGNDVYVLVGYSKGGVYVLPPTKP